MAKKKYPRTISVHYARIIARASHNLGYENGLSRFSHDSSTELLNEFLEEYLPYGHKN